MEQGEVLGLSAAGFHRMAFTDWGPVEGALTVCAHGLTRNGRDFDRLAMALAAQGRRVICPDVVGRGRSDWLPRPELYNYPQYLADMTALLARLGDRPVDWVGTSMGGLIGLMLAAQPHTPIRRLVLNDIGPFIPRAALERLATYVGANPCFANRNEAEQYLRRVHAPFGLTLDADWEELARHSLRNEADGSWRLHYDPAIGRAFQVALADINLWPLWDLISCPVLVIRGAQSDLLLPETVAEMTRRGPAARLVEWPGCGHAPSLMEPAQIDLIAGFLSAGA